MEWKYKLTEIFSRSRERIARKSLYSAYRLFAEEFSEDVIVNFSPIEYGFSIQDEFLKRI